MIKKFIIILMAMINCFIYQKAQAQECNANFTYTINSENGLFVTLEPNELSTIASATWYFDGVPISSSLELLHTFPESGSHFVCLKVISTSDDTCIRCMNICVDMAIDLDTSTTSVGSMDMYKSKFELFPNPSLDYVVVQFNTQEFHINTEINFKISDVDGRVLKTIMHKAKYGENELVIDVADLPVGVYFIHIQSDQLYESHKFIKK